MQKDGRQGETGYHHKVNPGVPCIEPVTDLYFGGTFSDDEVEVYLRPKRDRKIV